MTKQEIITEVSRRTGIEQTASRVILDEAINVVRENLCKGNAIYIRGLFTLAPKKRAEKVGQNITKGTSIILPAHYAPHAKFSAELRKCMKANLPIKKK